MAQRGAGANMSVDIAASTGSGLAVSGTTVVDQGLYLVPPHTGTINEAITAADPTNPRVDQVIVQCLDNVIDGSAGNRAQTIVLTGTPTGGATIGIGGNRNGAASLPASSYRLADVLVPAGSSSVTNANIFDRRPKVRAHANIATSEVRTNVAYGLMPTPDQVTEIVLPTDGLIAVLYQATWSSSVSGVGNAAIFLNATQVQVPVINVASPAVAFAATPNTSANLLVTDGCGLTSGQAASNYTGDLTTGQIQGMQGTGSGGVSGPCYIFATAGTYHVNIQFKSSSGNVTALNRKLWVWTMAPDQGMLA